MNPTVQYRWERIRTELREELGDVAEVSVRIPDWQPTSLDEGLQWIRASVYEGFYVGFRIEKPAGKAIVWLKKWEFGEDEPAWSEKYSI